MNCAHDGCGCRAGAVDRNGQRFCSESCADQSEGRGAGRHQPGTGCNCGHPGCEKE